MPLLKIGVQLASLRMPLRQAVETAASLGAAGVEINGRDELRPGELSGTGLRQFRKLLDDFGLRVASVAYPTQRGYNVPDDLQRRVDGTKAALKLAAQLGAGMVINSVGRIPAERSGPDWDRLLEVLVDLARHGDRVGAHLVHRTGAEDAASVAALLDALPEGTLGVDLDPGGLVVHSHSPLEMIRAVGPAIVHVRARDGVRDVAAGRDLEVPLGRGTADFPAILGTLEDYGYRGWLTVERRDAEDPVREIGDAIEYLKSMD